MSKYNYTDFEKQLNTVLAHQSSELSSINFPNADSLDESITSSEELLKKLGYKVGKPASLKREDDRKIMVIPTWEKLCLEAERHVGGDCVLEDLFTEDELNSNSDAIRKLNAEYSAIHHLDGIDISISAVAALTGAAIDLLLVGIPQKGPDGLTAGSLSNYVRAYFEKKFPSEEMEKLANSKESKVSFDAQDNRHTTEYVQGLSAYYHRLLSLGHDPLLGFVVGVFDILTGRMTTIDKAGKIVSQVMENYADRKESDIFAALAKQVIHFKSDITTSMGLPAPLMGLFNLLQFGSIGEEEQTIAEIVQGMYYEGYDFIHICSSTITTMLIEAIVRISYTLKKIHEGNTIKDSIPFSLDRTKNPKLCTMLFISHSISCSVNAGKIYFKKNPLEINYPEWLTFAKYSYKQLKWILIQKPQLKEVYINNKLLDNLQLIYDEIDNTYQEYGNKYNIILS